MKRHSALFVALVMMSTSSLAHAVDEYDNIQKKVTVDKKEVPWRNSTFTYENSLSAISLDPGADLTANEYYGMSFDFKPRWYFRDDFHMRSRLVMDVELTTPDSEHRRFTISDLSFDAVYHPSWMKIPVVDISVVPSMRVALPTSIVSQGRSMLTGLSAQLMFLRQIPLLKGDWLQSVGLTVATRGTKEFYSYKTSQVDERDGCLNSSRPECQHTGSRNRSWRLANLVEASVKVWRSLTFTMDFFFLNDFLYELDPTTKTLSSGETVEISGSNINHRASTWMIFDVSYDVFPWLTLSAGTSTYYAQLAPDSTYRTPFFNRATNIYFDVTIPIAEFTDQVQDWTGWGRGK